MQLSSAPLAPLGRPWRSPLQGVYINLDFDPSWTEVRGNKGIIGEEPLNSDIVSVGREPT